MKIVLIVFTIIFIICVFYLLFDDKHTAYKYKIVHCVNGLGHDVWIIKYKNILFWHTMGSLTGVDTFYSKKDAQDEIDRLIKIQKKQDLKQVKDNE